MFCLWYNGTALDAAKFYAETFPNSKVGTIYRAPSDYPSDLLPNLVRPEVRIRS